MASSPSSTAPSKTDSASPSPSAAGDKHATMRELRRLLLRPDRDVVADLRRRIAELEVDEEEMQAEEVSRVLPEAIRLHTQPHDAPDDADASDADASQAARSDALADALAPTVERTLHVSVERNPQPLVDAIFPIIGPAIRRSVSEAMNSLVANVNQTLDRGFSLKGLRWRIESWRTGTSFADVVLRHTLLFRVEQIFLIDRETGLPMQHLTNDAVQAEDSALVSSMLTAIQDFVHDSFELEEEETLENFSVGSLSVWVEHGPRAALAAAVRGTPDPRLRETLHRVNERVHHQFRDALVQFEGDAETLAPARPVLEQALLEEYDPPRKRPSPVLWLVILLLLGGLGWWGYTAYTAHQQWTAFTETLNDTPGLVVTDAEREDGAWVISGLRDPLAPHPDSLLQATELPATTVRGSWEPYRSMHPTLVLQRAARRVEAEVVLFAEGTTLLNGQSAVLDRLSTHLMRLYQAADDINRTVEVQVRGHHSSDGPQALNEQLAEDRALFVRAALRQRSVPEEILQPVSATGEPIHPDLVGTNEEQIYNRGVTIRAMFGDR